MGWCSATFIFDDICKAILEDKDKKEILKSIIIEFEGMDWDCQFDSDYFEHPFVNEIFRELHPDWFEEE